MNRELRILHLLKNQFNPIEIELKNVSDQHAGHTQHLGAGGVTGETHYQLKIISSYFNGVSRLDRQRMIFDLLKDEFKTGLHAFEMKAVAANELQNNSRS